MPDCRGERTSKRKMSDNPDRSYGWYKAHCFNDYMERVIGISLIIISLIIFIIAITLLFTIVINNQLNDYIMVRIFLPTI